MYWVTKSWVRKVNATFTPDILWLMIENHPIRMTLAYNYGLETAILFTASSLQDLQIYAFFFNLKLMTILQNRFVGIFLLSKTTGSSKINLAVVIKSLEVFVSHWDQEKDPYRYEPKFCAFYIPPLLSFHSPLGWVYFNLGELFQIVAATISDRNNNRL